MDREEVIFTCLTNMNLNSKEVQINAKLLKLLTHEAICELLSFAKTLDTRMEMSPRNGPEEPEDGDIVHTDYSGTRWMAREGNMRRMTNIEETEYLKVPSVLISCMDDSSVRGRIPMADEFTFNSFYEKYGDMATQTLIDIVNGEYLALDKAEPSIEQGRNTVSRRKRTSIKDPLETIIAGMDVTYGKQVIKHQTTTVIALKPIMVNKNKYAVDAGIYKGRVYAGTTPKNEAIEAAIIRTIENNPEHVFVMEEFELEMRR